PSLVQQVMDEFAARTGRQYRLFDYFGDPQAERVLVLMGSGVETARETVEYLRARGEKVGVLSVRRYRPLSVRDFLSALPPTARARRAPAWTRDPGAVGEPLDQDVVAALFEDRGSRIEGRGSKEGSAILVPRSSILVLGGRYGLSSKEFTPAMVKAVFD